MPGYQDRKKKLSRHEIVLFCALSIFDQIGGIQRFNQRIIDAAARCVGHEIGQLIVLSLADGDGANLAEGVHFIGCRHSRFALFFAFVKILVLNRPTAIFLGHVNLAPLSVFARMIHPHTPIALFVHGIEVWNDKRFRPRKWYEPALIRNFIDSVISVSRFSSNVMRREFLLGNLKMFLLANAVDLDADDISLKRDRTIKKRTRIILSVARLVDRDKCIDRVIRAFAILSKRMPGVEYHIVGEGYLKDELRMLARETGVEGAVRFRGRVSDDELAEAYSAADIFVLPSKKEGFGIVFLEAWKYGLPVICGDSDASSEVVIDGSSGIVVDSDDVNALAAAMERLLSDDALRAKLARNGFDRLRHLYDNETFRKTFRKILASLTHISGKAAGLSIGQSDGS